MRLRNQVVGLACRSRVVGFVGGWRGRRSEVFPQCESGFGRHCLGATGAERKGMELEMSQGKRRRHNRFGIGRRETDSCKCCLPASGNPTGRWTRSWGGLGVERCERNPLSGIWVALGIIMSGFASPGSGMVSEGRVSDGLGHFPESLWRLLVCTRRARWTPDGLARTGLRSRGGSYGRKPKSVRCEGVTSRSDLGVSYSSRSWSPVDWM